MTPRRSRDTRDGYGTAPYPPEAVSPYGEEEPAAPGFGDSPYWPSEPQWPTRPAGLQWPSMEEQPATDRPDRYERVDGTRNAARDGVRRPVREADWPWSTPESGWGPGSEPASAPASASAAEPAAERAWSLPGFEPPEPPRRAAARSAPPAPPPAPMPPAGPPPAAPRVRRTEPDWPPAPAAPVPERPWSAPPGPPPGPPPGGRTAPVRRPEPPERPSSAPPLLLPPLAAPGPVRGPVRRSAPPKARRRRRRWPWVLLVLLLVAAVLAAGGYGAWRYHWLSTSASARRASAPRRPLAEVPQVSAAPSAPAGSAAVPSNPANVPQKGAGTFSFADTQGPLLGTAGVVKRFRIAVEDGTAQDPVAFANTVDQVLGDPRSWIASGQLRVQRVPKNAPYDFTIYLASPATSEQMCATGGLHTEQYTSCRLAGQVIINLARWLTSVPNYGAPLDVYRAYAVNHEVGHEFGHGHEACTGQGKLAPVMQQQTLGLKGCLANPWPFVDGQRYAGPPIP